MKYFGNAGFFLQDDLSVASNAGGELGRKSEGLVERVGVQRLRSTENGCHRFDGCANNVVVRILSGQRPTRSLTVRSKGQRLAVFRLEVLS